MALDVFEHLKCHDVTPTEEEYTHLIRAAAAASMEDKVDAIMHDMVDYVPACGPAMVEVFHMCFIRRNSWSVSTCTSVDDNGICEANKGQLRAFELDEATRALFCQGIAKLWDRRCASAFDDFHAWVAERLSKEGPFDAVIDGANVGMHNQNWEHGAFNMIQTRNVLRALQISGKKPLVVLHRYHFDRDSKSKDPQIREACVEVRRAAYIPHKGTNDDWYWLYLTAMCGKDTYIISNDRMRDHTFQLLAPKYFSLWRERQQVFFTFVGADLRPVFAYPPVYSRRIQTSTTSNAWYFPIVPEQETEGEQGTEKLPPSKWFCAWR